MRSDRELDDDVGAELQVVKEEIEEEILPAHLEVHLPPNEGEAGAEFEQEPRDVLDESSFELELSGFVANAEEVEAIRVLQALACEIGLRLWGSLGEVGERLSLALNGSRLEVMHEDSA